MIEKEKFRAEIGRRVKCHTESCDPLASAYVSEDNAILSLIDSMQEETVSEELDIAASEYLKQNYDVDNIYEEDDLSIRNTFKAGAQWQKQQMMKDAVSGTIEFVERDGMCKPTILYEPNPNNKMQLGEEVKIIIIKP